MVELDAPLKHSEKGPDSCAARTSAHEGPVDDGQLRSPDREPGQADKALPSIQGRTLHHGLLTQLVTGLIHDLSFLQN